MVPPRTIFPLAPVHVVATAADPTPDPILVARWYFRAPTPKERLSQRALSAIHYPINTDKSGSSACPSRYVCKSAHGFSETCIMFDIFTHKRVAVAGE
jgi:hypothetical protein